MNEKKLYWATPANSLEEILPIHRVAYILPDNTVWVMADDGSRMIKVIEDITEILTGIDPDKNNLVIGNVIHF